MALYEERYEVSMWSNV